MTFDAEPAHPPSVKTEQARDDALADLISAVGDYFHHHDAIWRVADLTLAYIGPPGKNGAHNGASKKIKGLIAKLKDAHGERAEFCFSWVERLRLTAHRFPAHTRLRAVDFNVHWQAGDLVTLKRAEAEAKQRKVRLTVAFVRKFLARRGEKDQPGWVTAKDELARSAVEADEQAKWLLEFFGKHTLSEEDRGAVDDALVEVSVSLKSATDNVATIRSALQSKAAA